MLYIDTRVLKGISYLTLTSFAVNPAFYIHPAGIETDLIELDCGFRVYFIRR